MITEPINEYFASKNIDVSYNTLGGTERLVKLYVQEVIDLVEDTEVIQSNYLKQTCYSQYYDFEPRTKYTGFEKVRELDQKFRTKAAKNAFGLIGNTVEQFEDIEVEEGSYLKELKKSFRKFKSPLLYFSGGLDSEFVARAMLDAKVKFTPVIFNLIGSDGAVLNLFDSSYAYKFCKKHNLFPLVEDIKIEELWNSEEFEQLSVETGITSPQILTHVYMVEVMSKKYHGVTHVFGGEVRFLVDIVNGIRSSNFALMAKVSPLGYQGVTYTTSPPTGLGAITGLTYYSSGGSAGQWAVGSNNPSYLTGSPLSGTWTTTPGTAYEYNISTVNITTNTGAGNIVTPSSGSAGYTAMGSGGLGVQVEAPAGTNNIIQATFTINVRKVGTTTPVVTSNITLRSQTTNYTPALRLNSATVGAGQTFTVPVGTPSGTTYTYFLVGGGGGTLGAATGPGAVVRGGGGGGAIQTGSFTVSAGQVITYTIGAGGASGSGGGSSIATSTLFGGVTQLAPGGGGGSSTGSGSASGNGNAGGSGDGSGAGGGGGATSVGGAGAFSVGGNGGAGVTVTIGGTPYSKGGGGGGGGDSACGAGSFGGGAGADGGGSGGGLSSGQAGTNGTGGGAGGGGRGNLCCIPLTARAGGSGGLILYG